jgi:hypothetical protein
VTPYPVCWYLARTISTSGCGHPCSEWEKFHTWHTIQNSFPVGGGTMDYTYSVLNISYSFAIEMRPKDKSAGGFILPAAQIMAAASEAWAGLLVVLNRVASG